MGVEHAFICKKCKTWIDLHKCYGVDRLLCRDSPFHPHSDDKIESYWGQRAFWFLWKHREHGMEVEMIYDTEDAYYEIIAKMTEVASHDEAWKSKPKESDQ